MTNSETKNFSQNVSSSYHLEDRNKNVPKLRFKGYNDEWKKVKIGEIYKERSERGNTNAELLSVTMNDGVKRRIDIEGKDISSEDKSNYKSVYIGDMVYNSMRMWQGANGISNYDGIVSPAYTVMFPRIELCNNFIGYLFKYEPLIFLFRRYSQGLTSDTWNLKYPQIKQLSILIPSLPEQEKIASFLTLIDKKIEKQKELVELLKKYKRGLLSQIFSQKLRFKDDNGNYYPNWEECRFDEIFQILGNNTLSRECLNYTNVGVKNIHYGDILVKYNTCINDEIDKIPNINSDINLNKISDDNYLKVGDVILADTAEDYTVGKACEIVSCKAKILSGLHTIPCRPKQYFAKGYLGYYLNSTEYHDKLIPLITGIKVSAISKKEIKKTIIKYPIYKEQEKIANLLLLIENKLNSNIKKLELFATYKKGLLQQLFI